VEIFDVAVRRCDGYVCVELSGELDVTGVERLDAAMRPLTGQYDADQITIDCSGLSFIDLRGIRALLRIARINRSSGRMSLRGVPPLMQHILELTGHDDHFDMDRGEFAVA
jgi:anti-anti-sigma factor